MSENLNNAIIMLTKLNKLWPNYSMGFAIMSYRKCGSRKGDRNMSYFKRIVSGMVALMLSATALSSCGGNGIMHTARRL